MFFATHAAGLLLTLSAIACTVENGRDARAAPDSSPGGAAIEVTDDAGQVIRLRGPARRIVSLVPSATETLIAIGAAAEVVGRTRFDLTPEVASAPSVGGAIDPSIEAIVELRPDLVVAWESDARQWVRQRLVPLGIPVLVVRAQDTTDIFRNLARLGRLTGRDSAAAAVAGSVRADLESVRASVAGRPVPTVLYVVYHDPPMTVGPATFIGQLIELAGGRSVFTDTEQLWPNVAIEEIVRRDPDILIVPVSDVGPGSVERYRKLTGWRDLRAVREGRVVAVPADLLNRASPGIAQSARVLRAAFHPELAARSNPRSTAQR